ncbi:MAG: hypothetical protein PHE59_04675 [Patescibacteria group bacterium]|nr:hypothetical protein [Patescibacteria group bacterium]MDD5164643.1 hypothetical protein [Patescibacteria group bacterium]MDD5534831.1 hypothetical protein [Patescibacteria group bacterium]
MKKLTLGLSVLSAIVLAIGFFAITFSLTKDVIIALALVLVFTLIASVYFAFVTNIKFFFVSFFTAFAATAIDFTFFSVFTFFKTTASIIAAVAITIGFILVIVYMTSIIDFNLTDEIEKKKWLLVPLILAEMGLICVGILKICLKF